MFMNYMDYSDDQCMSMFTMGQKAVMQTTLSSARAGICSPENLLATGTRDEDLANSITCAPIPQFCENRRMICAGSTVGFEGASYNATTIDPSWSFEGGEPATSSSANPTVTYANPGTFAVTLTASNASGSNSVVKSNHVIVSADAASNANGPFAEGFEDAGNFNSNFLVFNADGSTSKWEHFPQLGYYSGACVRMNNFNNTATESDELITPSYNISSVPNPVFQFALAGAERGGEPNDVLRVSFSTNCGQSWGSPRLFDFADINSAGLFTSEFIPNNPNYWRGFNISLASFSTQQNLRAKFEYVSGTGDRANHVYIDDIKIGSSLGFASLKDEIGMSLYPNPASDNVQLSFETTQSEQVSISVYNMLGMQVLKPLNTRVATGSQQFNLNTEQLPAGLYSVAVDIDGRKAIKKFVKK
jgi:PKD repeat protein